MPLRYPPSFDSRVVMYPGTDEVYAYFCWRQADSGWPVTLDLTFSPRQQPVQHYILGIGATGRADDKRGACYFASECDCEFAHSKGTLSGDKNEILFKTYGINYNELNPMFRKGSILLREAPTAAAPLERAETKDAGPVPNETDASPAASKKKTKAPKPFDGTKGPVVKLHEDLITKTWWSQRSWLLA